MTINTIFDILKKVDNQNIIITNKDTNEKQRVEPNDPNYPALLDFYNLVKASYDRANIDTSCLENLFTAIPNPTTAPTMTKEEMTLDGIEKLIKFFTEFQFEPNFRFVNSLCLALTQSQAKAKDYVKNYFELIDSPYSREVNQKIKSDEFRQILKAIGAVAPTKTVNNRFKLYYGSQGTGKTTIAMKETNGQCMVCNNSMLPNDLMENFTFENGQATFNPSPLWKAMENGTPIVLDEINLLPFDSLRFLQTILDGKKEFLYKDYTVKVADGFKIIGTMNLVLNGMIYGLPEPLVDRAETTEKFSLTAKDLLGAII
jgi:hypothetical protein